MTWAPHPAYDGVLVSPRGDIFDVWKPAILNQTLGNKTGHLRVWLRGQNRYVHHLVLETYVGPRPPGLNGLHANDVPSDNHVTNLRWGTQAENIADALRNGLWPGPKKTHCPQQHEYTAANTYRYPSGRRECLTCKRKRRNEARDRRAAERRAS